MAFMILLIFPSVFLSAVSSASSSCTRNDFARIQLPCDPKTRSRSIVYYQNSSCKLDNASVVPKPVFNVPCLCNPGKGLSPDNQCQTCQAGQYSAGGEILDDWKSWIKNGTVPPQEADITVYCDSFRSYVAPCKPWLASDDGEFLESGDNANTRCLQSVMVIKRQFVSDDSYVSFDYHVQGRKCYSTSAYVGCDGFSFFVDDKKLLKVSTLFRWTSFKANITKGYHKLKWVYRKHCYSFNNPQFLDKAYIKSITMVGVAEPKSDCHECPKGSFNSAPGAKMCKKCSYFQYQDQTGQTSCKPCPEGFYSMLGDSICFPLRNCTSDDIIAAPGNISTCYQNKGNAVTTVTPKYHEIPGMNGKMLCYGEQLSNKPQERPCRCQPGFEVLPKSSSNSGVKDYQCLSCRPGQYSDDGITCKKCPAGQVALTGKHYYYWPNGSLPEGFKSECVGDCHKEGGWIPSGNFVRTGHVIGDVDSYIETPEYNIVSSVAELAFNCSIQCNVTEPKGRIAGLHLADPKDCLLTLHVFKDGNFSESINCTRPKGKYLYRHENKRDGTTIFHRLRLTKKGKYKFRWQFHQSDETRSLSANFEAKLSAISVVGVRDGEARNCTQCPAGYYSFADRTDCGICIKGFYSAAGSTNCTRCPEMTFAPKQGTSKCLRCGQNTKSTEKKDGCDPMGCKFSPEEYVHYDLSMLSRPGGPMFRVIPSELKATKIRTSKIRIGRDSPPFVREFYINLCTVNHDNTSCLIRDLAAKDPSKSFRVYPTMACKSGWSWSDRSIGFVIGYKPNKNPLTGLTVELLHGDRCWSNGRYGSYNTTVDMICDMKAGIGNPVYNTTTLWKTRCTYRFSWRSLYACPKCRPEYFKKVYDTCVNGRQNFTYAPVVPCWGDVPEIPKDPIEGECRKNSTRISFLPARDTVNKVMIAVGVVIIVVLIGVAVFFFCKHRNLRFKYFSMITRNKPMSRLEEEEDEAMGHIEDDFYHSGANAPIVRP